MTEKLTKMRQGGVFIFATADRVDFLKRAGYEVVESVETPAPQPEPEVEEVEADEAETEETEPEEAQPRRRGRSK